ncbi:hypothetical protein G1C96_0223 [Bifidobacterium sp. DSM 109958]|uniref:Histidine kinase n=2 Tax=Bifidobacterium moraviense TaxID=2675323 RepID=A0A7Y0HWV9_9BIFI|nr:hypothetical protein [Bifidobacterium sp. DSM 109958]
MFGVASWLLVLLVSPPRTPIGWAVALALVVVIAVLSVRPRLTVPVGLTVALAACFTPDGTGVAFASVAAFATFLTAGYALDGRIVAVFVAGYALLETAAATWPGGLGAHSGAIEVLRALTAGLTADGRTVTPADVPPAALWAFGMVLSMMISGFAALFGHSFRRNAAAGERLARSEAMVGRLTREQQLAHLIHDSVANDMSVIAMLAWRAKAGLRGGEDAFASDGAVGSGADLAVALDAIYERSHHALDRVHEVIDVLDGKRALADLDGSGGSGTGMQAENGSTGVSGPAGLAGFVAELERYLEDQDRVMAMVGMPGISRVTVGGDGPGRTVPSPQVRQAILGFVEEVYANIVRHAAWSELGDGEEQGEEDAYSLFVTVEPHRVRIAEVNAIGDGASVAIRGTRHGRGLALRRETIESLGGTLNAAAQDGTWTIAAEIPLSSASP